LTHTTKTPVQQFGFEYLKQQTALGRPISPHLNIYKPQLTWIISGGHRISGCIMSGSWCFKLFLEAFKFILSFVDWCFRFFFWSVQL